MLHQHGQRWLPLAGQAQDTKSNSWLTPEIKHVLAFIGATVAVAILNSTEGDKYQLQQAPAPSTSPPPTPATQPASGAS